MKNLKYYSTFSLFVISIMVMLMHSIIPHHHHQHSILSHKDNHCQQDKAPESHKEHEDSHHKEESTPFHCHAFNDADWYKQDYNIRFFIKDLYITLTLIPEIKEDKVNTHSFAQEIQTPHKEQEYFRERFSRPPPNMS